MEIKTEFWGTAKDGKKIYKYYVTNGSGAQVVLTSLGASIVSVLVPDKDGKLRDVSLGFDTPEDYYNDGAYLGSYDVSLGEIESCAVDDGYLVILMNVQGSMEDKIYKTKKRIAIP